MEDERTPLISRLETVPQYVWTHGCGPTAAATILAHWDAQGYSNLFAAEGIKQLRATSNVADEISSPEHNDKYGRNRFDHRDNNDLPDPDNSIADFFHTSEDEYGMQYGWSPSKFQDDVFEEYAAFKGYEFDANTTEFSEFSYEDLKAEIDAGRPVMAFVDSGAWNSSGEWVRLLDADAVPDHWVPIFGYEDRGDEGQFVFCHYNWFEEESVYKTMEWRYLDNDALWGISALTTVRPVSEPDVGPTIAELGRVEDLTHLPQIIELEHIFTNPVVIAAPLSFEDGEPAAVCITDVQADRFTIQVQEPSYLDGGHAGEDLSFLVVEEGSWRLPDGTLLEAGTLQTNKLTSQDFETVAFSTDFDAPPAVLSQVQSKNGGDWVVSRQTGLTADGFQIAMQKEEALNGSADATEQLGWLAIEQGTGTWDGHDFQAGDTGDQVTEQWTALSFADLIDETPQLFAALTSFNDPGTAALRYRELGPDGVQVKVEEEQSAGTEVVHTAETVSFLAIEGTGTLVAEPIEEQIVA